MKMRTITGLEEMEPLFEMSHFQDGGVEEPVEIGTEDIAMVMTECQIRHRLHQRGEGEGKKGVENHPE